MKSFLGLTLCIILMAYPSHGSSFHKYQRGEQGDVILEGYHALVKRWEPLVLFFGFVDDMDDCQEVAKLWNEMHSPVHRFRFTKSD